MTIDDPAVLADFAAGRAVEFGIELGAVPNGMFELKVNAMTLASVGASTTQSTNAWVTHSGVWSKAAQRRWGGRCDEVTRPSTLELSRLSAIQVTIDCIGYAPQGAGALMARQVLPTEALSRPAMMND